MSWLLDTLPYLGELGGLVALVYLSGKGAKGAREWYRKRHDERVRRLRGE